MQPSKDAIYHPKLCLGTFPMVVNQTLWHCEETLLSLLRCAETQCKKHCSHKDGSAWCAAVCLHNSCCGSFNAPNPQQVFSADMPLVLQFSLPFWYFQGYTKWIPLLLKPGYQTRGKCSTRAVCKDCFPKTCSCSPWRYFRSPGLPEQNSVFLLLLIFVLFLIEKAY